MQVELFQHFLPPQRPQPSDWRPSDHGWVRWGIAVPDFDEVLARLGRFGIETITPATDFGEGIRRVCVRDPDVGAIIEIMEDGPAMPGGARPRQFDLGPGVVYAAVSVPDLGEAGKFWTGVLGLEPVPADALHTEEMEALWGLKGADRQALVVKAGDCFIEIVEYRNPEGRPRRPDARSSDQGMMNVALGYRDRPPLDRLVARLEAIGSLPATPLGPGELAASYFFAPDGTPLEILAMPAAEEHNFGFAPRPDNPVKGILDAIAG
jgi:catechol 2,3-dioxygenase-like lactoylglutathione lyase family enzyme